MASTANTGLLTKAHCIVGSTAPAPYSTPKAIEYVTLPLSGEPMHAAVGRRCDRHTALVRDRRGSQVAMGTW